MDEQVGEQVEPGEEDHVWVVGLWDVLVVGLQGVLVVGLQGVLVVGQQDVLVLWDAPGVSEARC